MEKKRDNISILPEFIDEASTCIFMTKNNFLLDELQQQIKVIQSVTKLLIKPPRGNLIGQIVSLFDILGASSHKKIVRSQSTTFKPIAIQIEQESPPIETLKGVGKKLAAQLRSFGINTVKDLKLCNPKAYKIPGISVDRIQKWQDSL